MSNGLPTVVTATLRSAREALGWRTTDVARELRCSRRFIEMCESGTALPSYRTLELWVRALGLEPNEIDALHEIRDSLAGA